MTLFSDVVGVVDSVMTDLGVPVNVQLKRFSADAGTGDPIYLTSTRAAVLEYKVRQVTTSDGRVVASNHSVTFLKPSIVVDEGDQITYRGKTNTVLSVASPVDASGRLITTAYL